MKILIKVIAILFQMYLFTITASAVDYSLGRNISNPVNSGILNCDSGQAIIGIDLRAGSYIDGIGILCRSTTSRITSGGEVFGRQLLLPPNALKTSKCVEGQILVGITGRSGLYVDSVDKIICRTPSINPLSSNATDVGLGGSGGQDYRAICSEGEHITSMEVKANAWMNNLKITCSAINQNLLSNNENPNTTGTSINAVYCFGAVGMNCGTQMLEVAACVRILGSTNCLVNEGSWGHDECCYRTNERGTWCGPQNATNPGCESEWSASLRYTPMPFGSWVRSVNPNIADADGLVDHNLYCALRGTILPREVSQRCCSRSAAPLGGMANLMFPSGKMICR